MGVKYDVIFKDRRKMTREAVCFGSMATGQWEGNWSNNELAERPADQHAMVQFHTANNIHPVWFEPDYTKFIREFPNRNTPGTARSEANKLFLQEMKILWDDMPVLQKVLTIHPLVGVVRAHLKDHPADLIITSLFLIRNLCNYSEMAASYRHFRSQGYRPRFCAIMAHIVGKNFGAMGRHDWSQSSLGEYNWINPNHFGKNGLLQLMGHTEETQFDFIQQPWTIQKGYRRDSFYRDSSNAYDPAQPTRRGFLVQDDRMIYGEYWDWNAEQPVNEYGGSNSVNLLKTRNIVDCYSIKQDEPVDPEIQLWNPVHGFQIFGRIQNSGSAERNERVLGFVEAAERLCNEAGISIRG